MATKKTSTPAPKTAASTAVAVKKPAAAANIVTITAALKAQAAETMGKIAPGGGNKITLSKKDGFTLPDGTKTQGPLELVIVDFNTKHSFYETQYDPNKIVPPGCFAIGPNPKQMTPSKNSPNMQSDSCQGCPMNEFKSAGNGKACTNNRVLAVLPPDADEDTPMWTLSVSPTALKAFDSYVAGVNRTFGMAPICVVTTVGLNPETEYPQLTFSNPVQNDALAVAYARIAEARDLLNIEPDVSGYEAPSTKGKKPAARR
jgi:hypothetical protein